MSDCWFWQVQCKAEEAAGKITENIVQTWGRSVMESLDRALVRIGTYWVGTGTPSVSEEDSSAAYVVDSTAWLAGAITVGSLIVAGTYVMWSMRGEEVRRIISGLLRMVVVSGTALTVTQLLIEVSDATSRWFLEEAVDDLDGRFATRLLDVATQDPSGIGWLVIVVGGLVGIVANLIQIGLMEVRGALLPLVAGLVPLAASAAVTDWGRGWLRRLTGWVLSCVMMKPAAAIVYGVALKMVSNDSGSDQLGTFVRGIILMALAAVALPALVRLIVPAAEAVGTGGGAAAVAGGALATGAMVVSRSGGRGGGGTAPSGADGAPGAGGGEGPAGPAGGSGAAGAPDGSAGAAGAPGSASGSGGGSASGSGAAGASGGSAGAAGSAGGAGAAAGGVGAVVMAGAQAVRGGVEATRSAAEESTGDGGASGAEEVER